MKHCLINSFFLSLIIQITSCNVIKKNDTPLDENTHRTIEVENNILKTVQYDNFINNLKFIKLETNNNCLLGEWINNVMIDGDQIFILDSHSNLFSFDLSGKFLGRIGKKGIGPNELQAVKNVCLNRKAKEIILYDIRLNAFLFYTYTGKFIKSVELEQHFDRQKFNILWFEVFHDNELLIQLSNSGSDREADSIRYNYCVLNLAEKTIKNQFIPFLYKTEIGLSENNNIENIENDLVLLTTRNSTKIFCYDKKANTVANYLEVKANDDMKFISSTTFEKNQPYSIVEVQDYLYQNSYAHAITNMCVTSKYIMIDFFGKRDLYELVFNRNTQKTYELDFDMKLTTEIDNYLLDITRFNDNGTIIKVLNAEYLYSCKNKYKPINNLYNLINSLDEEDNPILALYDLDNLLDAAIN